MKDKTLAIFYARKIHMIVPSNCIEVNCILILERSPNFTGAPFYPFVLATRTDKTPANLTGVHLIQMLIIFEDKTLAIFGAPVSVLFKLS